MGPCAGYSSKRAPHPRLSPRARAAWTPICRSSARPWPSTPRRASRLHAMVGRAAMSAAPATSATASPAARLRPSAEAYLLLRTLPGEQAQVDWAYFGHHTAGRARRPLMAFVMVLSYSRHLFVHFSLDASMDSFPQRPRPGVCRPGRGAAGRLERQPEERRARAHGRGHPVQPATAGLRRPPPLRAAGGGHRARQREGPRGAQHPVHPPELLRRTRLHRRRRPERAGAHPVRGPCRLARLAPGPAPDGARGLRPGAACPLACPEQAWDLGERLVVESKTPYVRFDLNDYSVPHTHVRKTFTVVADPERVRVFDAATVLATHRRSFDRAQIEDEAHPQALVAHKRGAREHSVSPIV